MFFLITNTSFFPSWVTIQNRHRKWKCIMWPVISPCQLINWTIKVRSIEFTWIKVMFSDQIITIESVLIIKTIQEKRGNINKLVMISTTHVVHDAKYFEHFRTHQKPNFGKAPLKWTPRITELNLDFLLSLAVVQPCLTQIEYLIEDKDFFDGNRYRTYSLIDQLVLYI